MKKDSESETGPSPKISQSPSKSKSPKSSSEVQQQLQLQEPFPTDWRLVIPQPAPNIKNMSAEMAFLDVSEVQMQPLKNHRVLQADVKRTRALVPEIVEQHDRLEQLLTMYCNVCQIHYRQGLNELIAPFLLLEPKNDVQLLCLFHGFYSKFAAPFFESQSFYDNQQQQSSSTFNPREPMDSSNSSPDNSTNVFPGTSVFPEEGSSSSTDFNGNSNHDNNNSNLSNDRQAQDDQQFRKMENVLNTFDSLLLYHYPDLYHTLSFHGLEPVVYSTPWFITLMASKLDNLNDIVKFWKSLLIRSDPAFIAYIGLAMLSKAKDQLLSPKTDISQLPGLLAGLVPLPIAETFLLAEQLYWRTPKIFATHIRYQLGWQVGCGGSGGGGNQYGGGSNQNGMIQDGNYGDNSSDSQYQQSQNDQNSYENKIYQAALQRKDNELIELGFFGFELGRVQDSSRKTSSQASSSKSDSQNMKSQTSRDSQDAICHPASVDINSQSQSPASKIVGAAASSNQLQESQYYAFATTLESDDIQDEENDYYFVGVVGDNKIVGLTPEEVLRTIQQPNQSCQFAPHVKLLLVDDRPQQETESYGRLPSAILCHDAKTLHKMMSPILVSDSSLHLCFLNKSIAYEAALRYQLPYVSYLRGGYQALHDYIMILEETRGWPPNSIQQQQNSKNYSQLYDQNNNSDSITVKAGQIQSQYFLTSPSYNASGSNLLLLNSANRLSRPPSVGSVTNSQNHDPAQNTKEALQQSQLAQQYQNQQLQMAGSLSRTGAPGVGLRNSSVGSSWQQLSTSSDSQSMPLANNQQDNTVTLSQSQGNTIGNGTSSTNQQSWQLQPQPQPVVKNIQYYAFGRDGYAQLPLTSYELVCHDKANCYYCRPQWRQKASQIGNWLSQSGNQLLNNYFPVSVTTAQSWLGSVFNTNNQNSESDANTAALTASAQASSAPAPKSHQQQQGYFEPWPIKNLETQYKCKVGDLNALIVTTQENLLYLVEAQIQYNSSQVKGQQQQYQSVRILAKYPASRISKITSKRSTRIPTRCFYFKERQTQQQSGGQSKPYLGFVVCFDQEYLAKECVKVVGETCKRSILIQQQQAQQQQLQMQQQQMQQQNMNQSQQTQYRSGGQLSLNTTVTQSTTSDSLSLNRQLHVTNTSNSTNSPVTQSPKSSSQRSLPGLRVLNPPDPDYENRRISAGSSGTSTSNQNGGGNGPNGNGNSSNQNNNMR